MYEGSPLRSLSIENICLQPGLFHFQPASSSTIALLAQPHFRTHCIVSELQAWTTLLETPAPVRPSDEPRGAQIQLETWRVKVAYRPQSAQDEMSQGDPNVADRPDSVP